MVARRCMVHNCPGNYTSLHKFPSDRKFENRLFIWLSASGNQELLHLPKNSLLQNGICNIHFEAKYFLRRGLSVSAVPTLYLPDPIEIPLDHYTRVESEGGTNDGSNSSRAINEPSTSLSDPIEIPLDHYTRVESEGGTNDGSNSSRAIPSTSKSNHFTEGVQMKRNRKRCREENAGTAVSTKIRRKGSLLQVFKVTSISQLSKDNRRYYHAMAEMQRTISHCRIQRRTYMQRLQIANNVMNHNFWNTVPEHIKNLFLCYKRNVNRPRCRRSFTLNEKIIALSIWKKSPKNYRFFQDLLLLPSTTTLQKLIMELGIKPGLCHGVFDAMEKNTKFFTSQEKYCILIFDEMQLSAGINYNATADYVEGIYIDRQGNLQFADHATVWMLKGVYGARPWKQTVAFTYGNSSNTYFDITEMFEEIVTAAQNIGLEIIACVCDQNASNVKAINALIQNSSNQTICINNREIIPLYDVPHLMKCIRNNLLTKNLQFSLDGKNTCIAKWEHIEGTYEIDRTNGPNRLLTKITDEHVKKEKIKKMKVAYCTQIFSATFAKSIYFYANYKPIEGDHIILSPDPMHTADLIRFFNNLFDSLNNFYTETFNNTVYWRNMTIWNEAIKIISSMKFIKNKPNDKSYPVVLKNWVFTLKNMITLNHKLKDLNINFAGRNFNQDPLENFFSLQRSHGGRNANPTCSSFGHYYQSLFINDFGKRISYKGNCENDHADYFIQTKHLIDMRRREDAEVSESFDNLTVCFNSVNDAHVLNILAAVTKKLKSECETCRELYTVKEIQKLFDCDLFIDSCHSIITRNTICERNIQKKAMAYFEKNIIFKTSHREHSAQLKYSIFDKIFQHILNMYIHHVNQLLTGKLQNVEPSQHPLFNNACNYYTRKCKRKRVPK